MARLIDEEGRLFGRVNIIDAFFVPLLIAAVVGGVAFVNHDGRGDEKRTVVVRVIDERFVIDAIEPGPVADDGVVRVIAVDPKSSIEVNATGNLYEPVAADVEVLLEVHTDDEGAARYEGSRLYVGLEVRLDLGTTIVQGKVIEVGGRPPSG